MFGLKKLFHGNSLGIPKDVHQRLITPPLHTRDGAELESRKHNLVLLYGNEMEGGRAFNPDVKPIYTDVFTVAPFVMAKVKKQEMIVPVVFNPPETILKTKRMRVYAYQDIHEASTVARISQLRPAPIKGELYQFTDVEVEHLDKEYSNGVFFDRVRVNVRVEHYGQFMSKVGNLLEDRLTEALFYEKRVHLYVARYKPFATVSILDSAGLRKERKHNQSYAPRYYYTRSDGK